MTLWMRSLRLPASKACFRDVISYSRQPRDHMSLCGQRGEGCTCEEVGRKAREGKGQGWERGERAPGWLTFAVLEGEGNT